MGQRWAWARLFIGPLGFLHGCFSNAEQLLHSVSGELALVAFRAVPELTGEFTLL